MLKGNLNHIAKAVIISLLVITSGAVYIAKDVKFNYVIEDYFPKQDDDSKYFKSFLDNFNHDTDYTLIAIENSKGIFQSDFLQDVDSLSRLIKSHQYTRAVLSPTNLKEYLITPGGVFQVPIIHISLPEKYNQDSTRIYKSKALVGSFFSKDAKHLIINITNEKHLNPEQSDSLLKAIQENVSSFQFDEVHYMGRLSAQDYYKTQMGFEIVLFTLISTILLILYMSLIYRNVWSIGIALVVIGFSIIWTIGLVMFVEGELNLMMTLLPVLLFVIGISDVVHILTRYIEELRSGKNKYNAIKQTFREVGLATLLTSVTTAIGFFSLAMSDAPPIQFFGVYTAIGVMLTYIIAITLLPSILVLLKEPKVSNNKDRNSIIWDKLLKNLLLFTFKNQKGIVISTLIIIFVTAIGINNIKINNLFLEDLDEKSPLKKEINYFENNFSGIRPLEVGVDLIDSSKSILDVDVIREIDKVENYLVKNYGAGFAVSPSQILKSINQSQNSGLPKYFKLPESDKKLKKLIKMAKKNKLFSRQLHVVSEDFKHGRISTKMNDIGSLKQRELNTKFEAFLLENTNPKLVSFKLTGVAHLLDNTNATISKTLLEGLGIAALIIAIIMGVVLKSLRMVIISLVPNIIPLLIIAAIIGFFGFDLKISTAIIFTIAFGICVDDTIHFLSKIKMELGKGKSMIYAIKRSYLSTGKAIVLTSVILSSGFITFMFSDFSSTVQVGLLISITLVFAVLSDLLLLPVLLLWFVKKKGLPNGSPSS